MHRGGESGHHIHIPDSTEDVLRVVNVCVYSCACSCACLCVMHVYMYSCMGIHTVGALF